ncbi:MAG: hypothetical protein HYV07_07150 [Deltaproteobacteria bacterium]|nr:hypothetical protein [Deltaproteobacteria bacterium]
MPSVRLPAAEVVPALPASLSDPDAPLTDALPRRNVTHPRSHVGVWIGAAGLGVAAVGSILGTMSGAPTVAVAPMPLETTPAVAGTEVQQINDGLQKAYRILEPLGLDQETALSSMSGISLSVELPSGITQALDDDVTIHLEPGARVHASIDGNGVSVWSNPGLERWVDFGFDTKLEAVHYDFHDASFRVRASGLGPDTWHESAVTKAVTERFGSRLPAAMREKGYNPKQDAQLIEHLQAIVDLVRPPSTAAAKGDGIHPASPVLSFSFTSPVDRQTKLSDDATVSVKAGTRVDVTVRLEGPMNDPKLASVDLRFGGHPVVVSEKGDRNALARMDVRGIRIRPGPEVELDYELGPEGLIDGLRALLVLTASAADPSIAARVSTGHFTRTELTGPRKGIQDKVDRIVEPRLAELIRKYDKAIESVSLMKIFGVSPAPAE